jgi:hypothetical protein
MNYAYIFCFLYFFFTFIKDIRNVTHTIKRREIKGKIADFLHTKKTYWGQVEFIYRISQWRVDTFYLFLWWLVKIYKILFIYFEWKLSEIMVLFEKVCYLVCLMDFLTNYPAPYTRGRRGCDRMVVGFTTTYAIYAYNHWCCDFE